MRILPPRKMSQCCLMSYSTHAMSTSRLGGPKDLCEATRSWLMDIARRSRFHVLSARSVERNSPPSPMPEFTSSVSDVHGRSPAISDPSFTARAQSSLDPKLCAPVVSNTAPSVYGAISHGRPAEIRQEAEECSRGDTVRDNPTIRLEQRLKDPEMVTNHHDIALRSLEAWSTTAFLMDPDTEPAPILIKPYLRTRGHGSRVDLTRWATTSHSDQSTGTMATLPAPYGQPLRQVSRHADQPRGSGTTQREPSRGSEDQQGRQIFTPSSPTHFSCASMERGIPDAHPLGPTTTEWRSPLRCNFRSPSHCQSSPRPHQRQGTGSLTGKHQETVSRQLSLKSFFSSSQRQWEHRDSLRCPQV